MSSEIFESREEDFKTLYGKLKRKVDDQIPRLVGEEKKRCLREVERGLEDAAILIQEMEEEVKKAPNPYRIGMATTVRQYNRDYSQLSREVQRSATGARDNWGFSRGDDMESMASSQRSRLLQGNESLNRASESVARSQMIAAETDDIGQNIITDLGTQRESLTRTRDRLAETDTNLSRSRRILNTMSRRIMTNKMILIFIIIAEIAILIGVVYWKFFSGKKKT